MRRAVLGVLLFLSTSSFSQSGSSVLITDIGARTTISLEGVWNSIVDPYETGMGARYFENAKPKTKSDLVEYDFDRSLKLRVPGDWNTQREPLLFYEGPMWYQRYFSYQKRPHVRAFLYFGGSELSGAGLAQRQQTGQAGWLIHAFRLRDYGRKGAIVKVVRGGTGVPARAIGSAGEDARTPITIFSHNHFQP